MNVKIVSDGTAEGTKVLDENGKMIPNVLSVAIKINTKKNKAEATIKIACPKVDVQASMNEVTKVEVTKE